MREDSTALGRGSDEVLVPLGETVFLSWMYILFYEYQAKEI
jgi:hypothetical protein